MTSSKALQQKVAEVFSTYQIKPSHESPIILAISGGKDSVVLLSLLCEIFPRDAIIAVYVDHALRVESTQDGEWILGLCREWGVEFRRELLDFGEDMFNIEARARDLRYRALRRIMHSTSAQCITTAHHQSDQGETLLMRLFSGSSLAGLSGMTQYSNNIFRPLLTVDHELMRNYYHEKNLSHRHDKTNDETLYRRNWIRIKLIPLLLTIYPALLRKLAEFAIYADEIHEYITAQGDNFLVSCDNNSFDARSYSELHPVLQREIIAQIYQKVHGGSRQGLSRSNIDEIRRFILTSSGGSIKSLHALSLTKKSHIITYFSHLGK